MNIVSKSSFFRLIIIIISVTVLIIVVSLSDHSDNSQDTVGRASLNQGNNEIYFDEYDFTIRGFDLNGATYFFLPSFLQNVSIDYSDSDLILYSESGEIYTHPIMNREMLVLVGRSGTDSADLATYRIGFYSSDNLYTMTVDLPDTEVNDISHTDYANASVRVITPSGFTKCYSKHALIKGRGNTTWGYEKKPYDIKFSKKMPVAELTPSDNWTLLANHLDPTKIRNRLAFDIADIMGLENVTESDWIDLYINGDYRGNYLVCHEPSKIVDGGYLEESNCVLKSSNPRYTFDLVSGTKMTIKYPKFPTGSDISYITSFTASVDNAINHNLPDAQYEIIDRYSFARRYLVDEISLNADYDFSSHFFYILPGEKVLRAGPCWDYDKSFGYPRYGARDWTNTELSLGGGKLDWDSKLTEDPEYYDYIRSIFSENIFDYSKAADSSIEKYYEKIKQSAQMDRIRWLNSWGLYMFSDCYNDIRYLKLFLSNRLQYLADVYNIDKTVPKEKINNDSIHELTLHMEDGTERKMRVLDGTLLTQNDLPMLVGDDVWCFDFSGRPETVTGFIPVFEDMDLVVSAPNYE